MKKIILRFLLAAFVLPSHADELPHDIFKKINDRMSFMSDVAIYKANHHLPIEDLEREDLILKKSASTSEKFGLEVKSSQMFLSSLISSAKAIQYRVRADLLSRTNSQNAFIARDLKAVVRPELLRLGDEINENIYEYLSSGRTFSDRQYESFQKIVTNPHLKESDKLLIFNALKQVKLKN
ncbi:chorismate mutase [Photobacterium angustum]|uniref:chorismate mutase n=2 Tax=Photobacterium angustum TaxID=661 RepID=A0A855SBM1_PHOAN|nr:chorismate mutase [Photobacterium angustum]PSX05481.1 chorismate mutase [Photobacterium angustum]PSX14212.1 chorismate mutase [Photobacterium angustum]PSX22735.1 chorismate mutase [Photobacterium angustum]PSX39724.1 chorismate mutase [Photobacterium angustum]